MLGKKSKTGRPTAYKPEFAEIARRACLIGFTDQELAELLGVTVRTLGNWKHQHEEFLQALKAGKDVADDRVERSLYERATGYRVEAVKIFMPAGAEEPVYAPYIENHAPDTTAAIFWLKNRRPEQWRDKQSHEHDLSKETVRAVHEIVIRGVRSDADR